MGKLTEILFSLVREAMGNERVTTCSPTAGRRRRQRIGFRWLSGLTPACQRNVCVCLCVSCLTQWVCGCALEDESVGGEEDGPLGGEQRRTSHQARGLLASIRNQVDPHAVHHQLLARQQDRPQQLGLHTDKTQKRGRQGGWINGAESQNGEINFTTSPLRNLRAPVPTWTQNSLVGEDDVYMHETKSVSKQRISSSWTLSNFKNMSNIFQMPRVWTISYIF